MKAVLIGVEEAFETEILEVAYLLDRNGLTVRIPNILLSVGRIIIKFKIKDLCNRFDK